MKLQKKTGEAFAKYPWYRPDDKTAEREPKLSFVKVFKPWNWLISTGIYIKDIEKLRQMKLDSSINSLRSAFNEKKIQGSGYMFLFTGDKKILIHPLLENQDGSTLVNPATGRYILDDIIKSIKNNNHIFYYVWDKPGKSTEKNFKKVAYLSYYEPLDWYINVTYYIDDIEKPVWELGKNMVIISLIMTGFAFIAAALISKNVSSPLQKLAKSAESIEEEDLEQVKIPVTGSLETKKLAVVLQKTFDRINNATKKLKSNEQNLRITLNSIGDAVIATDINGNITRINQSALSLTGYNGQEILGLDITKIVKLYSLEENNLIEVPVQNLSEKTDHNNLKNNLILISRNNNEHHVSYSKAPIKDDNENIIGDVFVFKDITEEVHLHEELRQSQKMRAIGQLAGGIAHDFNNILGGIIMTVELLETKLEKNSDNRRYLDMIIQSSQRAADLISKLLAFARKQPEASSSINLLKPLKEAIEIVEQTIDKRIIISKLLPETPVYVTGDPSQLQSSFLNILINASHAMPEGGDLYISLEITRLDSDDCFSSNFPIEPGKFAKIKIKDTGCGISPNHLERIFEPFFTTKPEGKGTGLGLPAVLGTIQQHKGTINVKSKINKGTTFEIFIPLSKDSKDIILPKTKFDLKGSGTVLIVDDEYVMRATGADVLRDSGYEVITAENGKEAIEIFEKNHNNINLVILDMIMPEMNGKDCFTELKKISSNIKVLLSSGFAKEEEVEYLKKEGVKGFIKKPFSGNELSQAVYEALSD
jgi:PAS domain S-box-containing protein